MRYYRGSALAGLSLAECSHRGLIVAGRCSFCRADASMTDGFTRRVKRLVVTPPVEMTLC